MAKTSTEAVDPMIICARLLARMAVKDIETNQEKILYLHGIGLTNGDIALATGAAPQTVANTLSKTRQSKSKKK